jgi:hypothetical protein
MYVCTRKREREYENEKKKSFSKNIALSFKKTVEAFQMLFGE